MRNNEASGSLYGSGNSKVIIIPEMRKSESDQRLWNAAEKKLWMSSLFFGCVMLYATRMAMPITSVTIAKTYGWTKTDSGTVLSCFFWGYTLTQVFGGHLSDQIGGEKVLLVSAIGWSLLTFCTPEMITLVGGQSESLWLIVTGRIALGALQGVHFPGIASIVSRNMPISEKTFFMGVVASGPSFGMLLSGSLGSFILENYGWKYVFRIIGILGISWVLILKYIAIDLTARRPHIVSMTDGALVAPTIGSRLSMHSVPWLTLFKSVAFWSMLLAHFCENNSFFILLSWLPTYFSETFPEGKGWVFNVVPWVVCPIFSVIGGWLADQLIAKGKSTIFVRKLLEVMSQVSKASLLLLLAHLHSYPAALICLSLAVAAGGFHTNAVFMNPQDIAPNYAGSVFGIMNTIGAIPGFVGVYMTGYILEKTQSWASVFVVTAILNLVGCASFVLFGTAKPIVPSPMEKL